MKQNLMFQKTSFYALISFSVIIFVACSSSYVEDADAGVLSVSKMLEQEFLGSYPNQLPTQSGKVHVLELVATEGEWGIVPPYRTPVWTYQGMAQGAVIRIQLGDTLKVKLTNRLTQPTTIHWHGVRVPNAMDGVPGVTQAPIAPGETFTYEFTPKDAGTFWFHPHLNAPEQIERGLYGVLVVEDPKEPVYSQDLVWVLDDWLLGKDGKIYPHFVTRHDLAHDGRWGNVLTVNGKVQPAYHVKPGERIRIRLVNVANGRIFAPMFQQLAPQVIAVDGLLTGKSFQLNHFLMSPGNRLDLDLVIPQTAAGKVFRIINELGRQPKILASLQVDDVPVVKTPNFSYPVAERFPNWNKALEAPLTHEYHLNAKRGGQYGIVWMIDSESELEKPVIELHSGRFSRLRFTNHSSRLHPMHLHGQFFRLLAVDGKVVDENFWRDTVLIRPKSSIDIGVVPLDKGVWANHCHILEHAEAGMMSILKVE